MRRASLAGLSRLARPSLRWTRLTPADSPLPQRVSRSRSFGRALSSASSQGVHNVEAVQESQEVPKTVAKLLAWNPDTEVPVVVNGYVHAVRSMKRVTFVSVNDGSSVAHLQAVIQPDQADGCEQLIFPDICVSAAATY
jgi:hypothetical protein